MFGTRLPPDCDGIASRLSEGGGGFAFAIQPHREVRPESGLVGIVEHIVVNKKVTALMWYRLMSKHESEWPYGIPKRDGKEGRWQASLKQSI